MKNRISASEMLKLFDNQWASTKDIMKIGAIGMNTALSIKNTITKELNDQGYILPKGLVPMEKVIEYFNINVSYLKKVALGG